MQPEDKPMSRKPDLYSSLERMFHEPHRLAIMSAVCGSSEGVSFRRLKRDCNLTDGNLSRHLRTLEEGGAVRLEKTFVSSRPRTTVLATESGREAFLDYLAALEEALARALSSAGAAVDDRVKLVMPEAAQS